MEISNLEKISYYLVYTTNPRHPQYRRLKNGSKWDRRTRTNTWEPVWNDNHLEIAFQEHLANSA